MKVFRTAEESLEIIVTAVAIVVALLALIVAIS